MWVNGNVLPGVLMYPDELDGISNVRRNIFCYPLKSYINEDDYTPIFDRICEEAGVKGRVYCNTSVYDIEPWGNQLLYRYIYILMMIIGVASICYQVLSYNRGRLAVRTIHEQLGAFKRQIFFIYLAENAFIIAVSAVFGTLVTIAAGKLLCDFTLFGGTIKFYTVSVGTLLKIALTFAIAVIFCGVVYFCGRRKKQAAVRFCKVRKSITQKNFIWQTSSRFISSNGFLANFFIRAFGVVMAAVMIFCCVSVGVAYGKYKQNNSSVDLVGFAMEDTPTSYYLYYILDKDKYTEYMMSGYFDQNNANEVSFYNILRDDNAAFSVMFLRQIEMNKKIKRGRTNLYSGLSENICRDIAAIDGVENVSYGYFETSRSWFWSDCDIEKMGAPDYYNLSGADFSENGKYLFASEYVDVNEEIFTLVAQYCETSDFSYEDFSAGNKSIIFLDSNSSGEYDDSMKNGTVVNLHNYYNYAYRLSSYSTNGWGLDEYSSAVYSYFIDNIYGITTDDEYNFNDDSLMERIYMLPAASTNVLSAALDCQNEIIKDFLGVDELPESVTLKLKPTQIALTYGLNSTFSSTNNIVASFLNQAGFSYSSYSQQKDRLKEKTIEAVILYGFSGVASLVIYILISAVVLMNQISKNSESLHILRKTGAENRTLVQICMIESLHQNIWCIAALPISILVNYVVVRRKIN